MTDLFSGDLRHRLTIQKRTNIIGDRGESIEQWEDIGKCWARITPLYGRELEVAMQRHESVQVKIVTRRQLALEMDSSYRLVKGSDVYCVGFTNRGSDDLRDIHIYTTRETP